MSSSSADDMLLTSEVGEEHHQQQQQQQQLYTSSLALSLASEDLIEGIGNEVLVGFVALTAILGCLFVAIRRFENVSRVSRIHPSNLIAVNDARQQQQQQQNHNHQQHQNGETMPFIPGTRTRFGTMDSNCPVCLNQLHLPIETNCGHLFCGRCIIIYWQHAQWRGGAIRCPVCRQGVNILLPCFSTNMGNSSSNSSSSSSIAQSLSSALLTATSELLNYLLSFLSWSGGPSSSSSPEAATTTSSLPEDQPRSANGFAAAASNSRAHPSEQPEDLLNPSGGRTTATANTNTSSSASTSPPDPNAERLTVIREVNTYNRRFSGEPRPWSDYLYDLPTLLRHLTNDFFSFNGLMYMFRIRIVLCVVAAIMYLISPLDMIPEAVFGIFGLFDDIVVVLLLAIYVTIIYRRFLSSRWEME